MASKVNPHHISFLEYLVHSDRICLAPANKLVSFIF
ncbi:hypothetical protein CCACVL1_00167 [Corchorus capsularis]|uniref:Uncharacterized protein n=1 Tax=Corchorus capsularis TaxID=210143 RepID=A0A1R3KY45_COCAP|nr:hypothetical protein CCACVL1_00167 [Corchorus capsularis]